MAKTKKVSVNALERYYKNMDNGSVIVKFSDELEVSVRRVIGFNEFGSAVNNAADSCFTSNNEYLSYMKDFAFKYVVLSYYTNITLPSSLDKAYTLIYGTDIYDKVAEAISHIQLEELAEELQDEIDYRVESGLAFSKHEMEVALQNVEQIDSRLNQILQVGETLTGDDISNLTKLLTSDAKTIKDSATNIKAQLDEMGG